jgi:hypothetical protein
VKSWNADVNALGLLNKTRVADVDIVIARGEISSGLKAQCEVGAAGVVQERTSTDGRVFFAGGVARERATTDVSVSTTGARLFLLLLGLLTQLVVRHKKIDHALRGSAKVTTAKPFRCCAPPQVVGILSA